MFYAAVNALSIFAILWPGRLLEAVWRLNKTGLTLTNQMGPWAMFPLAVIGLLCAITAIGFFSGRRWSYRLGVILITAKFIDDTLAILIEPRPYAWTGALLAVLALLYMSTHRVKRHFFSWLGF